MVVVGFAATALVATDLGATFLAAAFGVAVFGVATANALAGLFLADFSGDAGVAFAAFFDGLPPKIPFQPSEYFSFVPTRVIVTESPFHRN